VDVAALLLVHDYMLVKVGIRLEIQVVQLQIMEKQKQITNPIIHQHNSTLCGISSNAGSMVVKLLDSLVHGCYSVT
jgi:hypothetical protein